MDDRDVLFKLVALMKPTKVIEIPTEALKQKHHRYLPEDNFTVRHLDIDTFAVYPDNTVFQNLNSVTIDNDSFTLQLADILSRSPFLKTLVTTCPAPPNISLISSLENLKLTSEKTCAHCISPMENLKNLHIVDTSSDVTEYPARLEYLTVYYNYNNKTVLKKLKYLHLNYVQCIPMNLMLTCPNVECLISTGCTCPHISEPVRVLEIGNAFPDNLQQISKVKTVEVLTLHINPGCSTYDGLHYLLDMKNLTHFRLVDDQRWTLSKFEKVASETADSAWWKIREIPDSFIRDISQRVKFISGDDPRIKRLPNYVDGHTFEKMTKYTVPEDF